MDFLKENWQEITLTIGGAFTFIWGVFKWWHNEKKKDKEKRDLKRNIENVLKAEKLALEIAVIERDVTIQEFKDQIIIEKKLDLIVDKHKANYAHFSVVKNGGDHITARKDCTTSIVYEKCHYSKQSLKGVWQNILVNSQLAQIYLDAVLDGYKYIHNFQKNMEDGEAKSAINPLDGIDVAWFYVGKIGIEEYFLYFQFRRDGVQSEYEIQTIKNYASMFYNILKDTYNKRMKMISMIEKKKELEDRLLEFKLQ
jgi:hypothetical protein